MKTIIAGTRTILDPRHTLAAIEQSGFEITEVFCGMARGPDLNGMRWAEEHGIPVAKFHANWYKYGRSAGPIRNEQMAKHAEALILVWNGWSSGSRDMLKRAKNHELKIYVYEVRE